MTFNFSLEKRKHALPLLAFLTVFLMFVVSNLWLNTWPSWELTVENDANNVRVQVFLQGDSDAKYDVMLENENVARECERCIREHISNQTLRTLTYDETAKPGYWKLEIGKYMVEIMEARLVVDKTREYFPRTRD